MFEQSNHGRRQFLATAAMTLASAELGLIGSSDARSRKPKLANGAVIVMEGLAAIETNENGVELAVPASVAASTAPILDAPVGSDVVKASFDAYKSRVNGKPVATLPHMAAMAGRKTAPRSDWLTGVQYRLNALGFGAGYGVGSRDGADTDAAKTQR